MRVGVRQALLEVKLPYDPVCLSVRSSVSVGWLVCRAGSFTTMPLFKVKHYIHSNLCINMDNFNEILCYKAASITSYPLDIYCCH